jgi:hypothetical protein
VSLLPKRSGATPRKCREFGRNTTPQKELSHRNINYLVAGWGARIRTWEWRNQNQTYDWPLNRISTATAGARFSTMDQSIRGRDLLDRLPVRGLRGVKAVVLDSIRAPRPIAGNTPSPSFTTARDKSAAHPNGSQKRLLLGRPPAKPHARPPPVFINELNAACLKRLTDSTYRFFSAT